MAERQASRVTSATLRRKSGSPRWPEAHTPGPSLGRRPLEGAGPPRALPLLNTSQPLFEEPLPPLADRIPFEVEPCGDMVVPEPFGDEKLRSYK